MKNPDNVITEKMEKIYELIGWDQPTCTGEAFEQCVRCRYRKERIQVLEQALTEVYQLGREEALRPIKEKRHKYATSPKRKERHKIYMREWRKKQKGKQT